MRTATRLVWLMFIAAAAVEPAPAVEGALGRTIPGTWVLPQGAVVGPEPGFGFTMLNIGYMGALGGARLDPVFGAIYENVQVNMSENMGILDYVFKTGSQKISLSSAFIGSCELGGRQGKEQVGEPYYPTGSRLKHPGKGSLRLFRLGSQHSNDCARVHRTTPAVHITRSSPADVTFPPTRNQGV